MGYLHKLKPQVVSFIIEKKHACPDISCRGLVSEIEKKFGIRLSKSSINSIFLREKLSSPVGRKSKGLISLDGNVEHGGFSVLLGLDNLFGVSRIAAEVLAKLCRLNFKSFIKDVENMFQGFLIFKSIFDTTLEPTRCYNNKEIWALVGRRPPKSAYKRIIKAIEDSQLFPTEVVREFGQGLRPIAGFRYLLGDGSTFFIDAGQQAIWHDPVKRSPYFITYYKSNSYINRFIANERPFSVFNTQESNIFSSDSLNFMLGINSQDNSKQLKQIELIDLENQMIESKLIIGSEKRFFLLGFWPWQLDIMSEFERRPAKQKFIWSDLGVEFCYQIEEVSIPQHLVIKEVKLLVVILKDNPLGAARIGILTNAPKDIIHNLLSCKELYHWLTPENTYKNFTKRLKEPISKESSFSSGLGNLLKEINEGSSLDGIFASLSHFIFQQFHHDFLPAEFHSWSPLKIKEVFLRQKAIIKRTKGFVVHNIVIDNKLCKQSDLEYVCQCFNERGIRDSDDRLLWFQMSR